MNLLKPSCMDSAGTTVVPLELVADWMALVGPCTEPAWTCWQTPPSLDLLDHRPIFCPGYDAVMHVHTVEVEVTCTELVSVLDAKGKQMRRPFARQGQMCMAILTLPMSTCMEPFLLMPSLGRLTLRDEGKTIAIGKIVQLIK